ncbi:type II asparaginase [Salmonella enterica subsp. enterica serovar Wedding]|nr:type II asparaginase [Salmonella enterica subsp. enterica serovar Wedding]
MKKYIPGLLLLSALTGSLTPVTTMAVSGQPDVTILATGGTIAGSSVSKTDTTDYKAGSLGINSLIKAAPELTRIANVSGEQISNVISGDIGDDIRLSLSRRVNQLLSKEGQQGVVITHGTDTLEESAFFLDLTVKSDHPVVLVGAMRPATAISADGPMNLLEAVTLAADKRAEKRGVLVVLNDRIGSAFYTTKTNATTLDTFKAVEPGYLGVFISGKPKFYYTPARATDRDFFDVSNIKKLPDVEILYAYSGQTPDILYSIVNSGAKGVVIAGNGNGNVSSEMEAAIRKLSEKRFPVVMSTRTGSGYVSSKSFAISSGFLNAQKSRILLQLALATGADTGKIAEYFDHQR